MRMTVLSLQHCNKQPVISNCILRLRGPKGPSHNASEDNLYSTSSHDWHFRLGKSPFLIFILTFLSNSTCLASQMAISLPLPSVLFPLSLHLCLPVGWLSSRDKTADNFIVDDRQMSNDTEPTKVNHGLIIDVYAARTSTHARSISLSFPLRSLHIIPSLTWSTRPSPTSQR